MRAAGLAKAITGIAALALLLAGCTSHSNAQLSPAAGVTSPTLTLDPAVDHVHGAVVKGDRLLLGTHTGLVAVDLSSGATSRVGSAQDDFMGLAALDTSLVASGHPDSGSTLPDPLGLLRSDDGGQTWRPVSLTGEVDFHGIATDGARIAGIGTEDGVLISADQGSTWQATGVMDAASIAWFLGELWIATPGGLTVWRDGSLVSPPALQQNSVALAAASDGSVLWAVFPDGSVQSTTNGSGWVRHGTVSALEALAATADAAYSITAGSVTVIPRD